MANKSDTKYLIKQRNVWFFRKKIPPKYRHAFDGVKIYKRTTGEEHLDKAIEVRDILLLKLRYQFKQIDTGKKATIPEIAQKHLRELQDYRQVQQSLDATEADREGAKELEMLKQEEIIDEAQRLFPLDTNSKEFEEASKTPEGYDVVQGIKKLDKSGNAIKFIGEATGQTFNAYVEEYCKYLSDNGLKYKTVQSYRESINSFSKDCMVENISDIAVKAWARNLCLKDGTQPITVQKKLDKIALYFTYLWKDLRVHWANQLNPFKNVDLPRNNNTSSERTAWTMDEMKKIYQADTIEIRKAPELKLLILIAMIYGCRLEEICQIKVEDICYEDNMRCFHITKSKTDVFHKFDRRYLPLVDCLVPIIDKAIEVLTHEDYIIPVKTNAKVEGRSNNLGQRFGRHRVRLGYERVERKRFNKKDEIITQDFHSYRKTVNTSLQMLGLKDTERSSICGWNSVIKSQQMAEQVYLQNQIAYPLNKRKEHLEQHVKTFTFDLGKY